MRIGVESCYGFGDALFNIPLIKAISEKHKTKIGVATMPHCMDAFSNIPWISEVISIPGLNHGHPILTKLGYNKVFQITQNVKFEEFRVTNPEHSLIDTPLWTGRQLGLPDFDQRPIFIPTKEELATGAKYNDPMPSIMIESVYKSGQSWADNKAFQMILDKYKSDHRICWMSNQNAPQVPHLDDMLRWTRRQIICSLPYSKVFFSVGSGFFCSNLAEGAQAKKVICLWTNSYYKYEERIAQLNLHPNIVWVHNHSELEKALSD